MNGTVFAAQKVAGVGVLIRDAKGRVVGACSKKIMAPLGAVETKAKAFEFGLQFARDLLIHDLVLEGDSLVIVNVLKEASPPPGLVPAMPYNVNSISHEFRSVEFSHICRQGNRPVHLLAKQACGIADLSVWIEENSYFLEQFILHDVNVVFHSQ